MGKIKIGKQYTFDTHNGCDELNDRSGSLATVLRALIEQEADILDVGNMYKVKFF